MNNFFSNIEITKRCSISNSDFQLIGLLNDSSFEIAIKEVGTEYPLTQKLVKDKVFLDIGAGYGEVAIQASILGASRVICYEPNSFLFDYLEKNTRQFSNIKINCAGVFSETTSSYLYYRKTGSASASIEEVQYSPNHPSALDREKTPIKLLSIEDVLKEIGHDSVIVKIDAEGAEYKIIDSLRRLDYSNITCIIIEYHDGLKSLEKDLNTMDFNVKIMVKDSGMGLIIGSRKS